MQRRTQREAVIGDAIDDIRGRLDVLNIPMRTNWRDDMKEVMELPELQRLLEQLGGIADVPAAITAVNFAISDAKQARRDEEDNWWNAQDGGRPAKVDFSL